MNMTKNLCVSHKLRLSILLGPSLNIKFLSIFLSEFAIVDFIPFPLTKILHFLSDFLRTGMASVF